MRRAWVLDKPHKSVPLHLSDKPSSKHDVPLRP